MALPLSSSAKKTRQSNGIFLLGAEENDLDVEAEGALGSADTASKATHAPSYTRGRGPGPCWRRSPGPSWRIFWPSQFRARPTFPPSFCQQSSF